MAHRQPFGTFKITTPRAEEDKLIAEHVALARTNVKEPNHWWFRAIVQQDDGAIIGKKVWHVDLDQNIVEVTESWHGTDTAFDIIRLAAGPAPN